jgi:tripartite-type tricarboxylate transporter receptor subunit TctC
MTGARISGATARNYRSVLTAKWSPLRWFKSGVKYSRLAKTDKKEHAMTKFLMAPVLGAFAALGGLVATTVAQAQTYPTKTITIVVTAAAGGVSDVVARAIGQRLTEAWGQQVVIENKGGAGHIIGAQTVAKAAPDGHTFLLAEAGNFILNPTLYTKERLSYDPDKDLVPITGLVRVNQALIANNGLAATNLRELIDLANKKPGEITYGTAGIGSAPHINMVKLENMAKVKLQAVHYRGAAPVLNDIMAGHINLMSVSYSLVVQPWAEKKLKVLAVGGPTPSPALPGIAAANETVPGFEANTWFGLATTGGTPREVVLKINAEVQKVLNDPGFQQRFMAPQMFESIATSPEEFSQNIKTETARWAKVIHEQNLVIE